MNRRAFFRSMIGGVAATAAVRTWPFRVYSFPSVVKPMTLAEMLNADLRRAMLAITRDLDKAMYSDGIRCVQGQYNWIGLNRSTYSRGQAL